MTLDTQLGLRTAGAAGVVFKPLSAAEFVRAENDLQQLLDAVATSSSSKLERREDSFGYTWIIVRDPDSRTGAAIHAAAGPGGAGLGRRSSAAVFKLRAASSRYTGSRYSGALLALRPDGEDRRRQRGGARAEAKGRKSCPGERPGALVRRLRRTT